MKKTILLFSLLIIGCKSLKNTENKPDFKKISTKSLLSQVINKKPEFDFIQIRSQATILNNNSKNQFNLGIKIKKDDKILIEGSVLIPLFKAFFTKNSLDFYEKISKTYYKGDYKYLSSFLNNDITFNSFQNIFLGQPITDLESKKWKQSKLDGFYGLEAQLNNQTTTIRYVFNPQNFSLNTQSIASKDSSLKIAYDGYYLIGQSLFPGKIKITSINKNQKLEISLKLRLVNTKQLDNFFFNIPKGYKEIKL